MPPAGSQDGPSDLERSFSAPTVSLPKGGGAIRGIGEKFGANPVTGTGSLSVPLALSPGRAGFGPQLSLSYDSGAGNGPFGLGWSLGLPAITRKTDKGLPRYEDATESDVYLLSGAEDLVPALQESAPGVWNPDRNERDGYTMTRYRPRIEGLFARIERWTRRSDGDTFWRSISKDNITTVYGRTSESRIADPAEPSRVFSWLMCESYDDRGNASVYEYVTEDSSGVDETQSHEANRTAEGRAANRHLKRIKYGNSPSRLVEPDFARMEWLFEVVFDYGEGHYDELPPDDQGRRFARARLDPPQEKTWPVREDPFSTYRAGFEVRTYRLCRRILMFHHFPEELGAADTLVRSTDLEYSEGPIASFLLAVTHSGYVREVGETYLKRSLPPVELTYSEAVFQAEVEEVDPDSLDNLPVGLDGSTYQWVDLDGEGAPGVLTEQAGEWFYKRNLSPVTNADSPEARFAPVELVGQRPAPGELEGTQQLMDLAGDGRIDLVQFAPPLAGYFERTQVGDWDRFVPFHFPPNLAWNDPNLRFVDLTGDGHADILIAGDGAFTWYPSLAEEGFGEAERVAQALEEERTPRLVFADGSQSVYLADMSGDGLVDLAQIQNGAVSYWPNLGYGRFGSKISMTAAPWFDSPDQFSQERIRLADIDGSGVTDIIYLGRDGVRCYFNESGNGWSAKETLPAFPVVDSASDIQVTDLFGNGTACLVWSSPLPTAARTPMRYVNLMGRDKPHLLVGVTNNLGVETRVKYASSTRFYLADRLAGKPWITRLNFPVHVVERTEIHDYVSRNRFVTRYGYHHGYFDGVEREFRGFGLVEQWDTEEFAALSASDAFPSADNVDAGSHVPPLYTKTWFHTGAQVGRDHVSDFFAGLLDPDDRGEYYREPGLNDAEARDLLLDDTVLPADLSQSEEREACRALKGSMLRQEVYALDGSDEALHPYIVTEQNFTIRRLQPQSGNRHAVFLSHDREAVTYHYERNPDDPRITHALTLEVDAFGNVLKEAAIGYGRRQADPDLPLEADRVKQTRTFVTYTESRFTHAIEAADDYRAPCPCETRMFELTGYMPTGGAGRFQLADLIRPDPSDPDALAHIFDSEISYEDVSTGGSQRRLIENVRTLYRPDDLGVAQDDPFALLPLGQTQSLALPGETYKLAFTLGLLAQVYRRPREAEPPEVLLPDPGTVVEADVAGGQVADRGGYVDLDGDGHWWIPTGRVFLSPNVEDTAAEEVAHTRQHFFVPRRYRDPFGEVATVRYDARDLLMLETVDAVGNRVTVGERRPNGEMDPGRPGNDYRVLQPRRVMDPNRNRAEAVFDALGVVAGTAVMGKPEETLGDLLDGFDPDLAQAQIDEFNEAPDPHVLAGPLLRGATTRIIYDVDRFQRSRLAQPDDPSKWLPVSASTLARETHVSDPPADGAPKIQVTFSYSDGFGREIQMKVQAEPETMNGVAGPRRWVGSGWTVFNNKGKPVRQYEPFFSATPRFEFAKTVGVSPILFYDPLERVVATLHPNHTYEKVAFTPWREITYDVNDTVMSDPRADPDIQHHVRSYFSVQSPAWQTWLEARSGGDLGVEEQSAASKAAAHADTPTLAHLDTLGRPFLTVADNGFEDDGTPRLYPTRVDLDIEGNEREVRDAVEQNGDARGRIVVRYEYDLLGNRIHRASMEAGERWLLNDVTGKPIRTWDSRGHRFRTEYDRLRRSVRQFVRGSYASQSDPRTLDRELLIEETEYGEGVPNDLEFNLRMRVLRQRDGAGQVTSDAYDFKGNLLASTREIAQDYKAIPDWVAPVVLEAESYTTQTAYDALNRPTELAAPDGSVIRHAYNDANLLERVEANLRGAQENGQPVWTLLVANVDYDAKGQRTRIDYGNGVSTSFEYDSQTFRLIRLHTQRKGAAFEGDCPQPSSSGWRGCDIQNLHYTYDPVGNVTRVRDDAQQTVFFKNTRVEPSVEYTYDPHYRLIEATGREHLGQMGTPIPHSYSDAPRVGLLHPGDGQAMGRYVERYLYDPVGNFLSMQHRSTNSAQSGWTRIYAQNEASLLEPEKTSNRLSHTIIGNGNPITETYDYDIHGNVLEMPHLRMMRWDFNDQLHLTQRQAINAADTDGVESQGERTWYVYDSGGERARKVTESATGSLREERLYLGRVEIDRRNGPNPVAREALHIIAGSQRIAIAESHPLASNPEPWPLIRFQIGDRVGSTSLELDDQAQVISYEEYTPYGSTAYQAINKDVKAAAKRYRYTKQERDEESGLYYYGARYYAPWLGRWANCDPAGFADGVNLFSYVRASPIGRVDPSGRQTIEVAQEGYVDLHEDQRPRPKSPTTGKRELESEHIDPLSHQRENMRNRATGKSPIPEGRGSSIDRRSPTVMIRKAAADVKSREDMRVWRRHRTEARAGEVTSATASQLGPEAGLTRFARAAAATGTKVLPGAHVAAIGQIDALYSDPSVRAFALAPENNPILSASQAELHAAVDTPIEQNAQRTGDYTELAATKDPKARTVFRGHYTPRVPGAALSTKATAAATAARGLLTRAGGYTGLASKGVGIYNIYGAYRAYKEGARHSKGEGALNFAGYLMGAPETGTMIRQAGELGSAVKDPEKLWDAAKSGASIQSIGLGLTFGAFR